MEQNKKSRNNRKQPIRNKIMKHIKFKLLSGDIFTLYDLCQENLQAAVSAEQ